MKLCVVAVVVLGAVLAVADECGDYCVVDTNQQSFYDASARLASDPGTSSPFHGQDAHYTNNQPSYTVHGDGTVTDDVTGLMWTVSRGERKTWANAVAAVSSVTTGGHTDWRVPTIKELYSLIQFSGSDPSNGSDGIPFIDDGVFEFAYGDPDTEGANIREIDVQYVTTNEYVADLPGIATIAEWFGVNFADGRIKGYPKDQPNFFAHYVRGSAYGENSLTDNGDDTVTDAATGLMWTKADSGSGMVFSDALQYCEGLDFAGHSDWRVPDVKELHTLVDYSRSPDTTASAAIDPVFSVTAITNEGGQTDYPFFWSSTTHASNQGSTGAGAYICFGRCMGYMNGNWLDVHGAGAQRSDPKVGDPADYPTGHGPQGDAIRIYNYVRCVRGTSDVPTATLEECAGGATVMPLSVLATLGVTDSLGGVCIKN